MLWLILAVFVGLWMLKKGSKRPAVVRRNGQIIQRISAREVLPGIKVTMEMVSPDPAEWAKEREAAKKAKQEAISRLVASFVRPPSLKDAFSGIHMALKAFADGYRMKPPDFELLWANCQAEDQKKTELRIRKQIAESYKQRTDPSRLIESLALSILHLRFMVENPDPKWKISASIKRLLGNLNHESFRSNCIGLLYALSDELRATSPELCKLCEEEINRLFGRWYADREAKQLYDDNLNRLSEAKSPSDKHFIINGLVDYLSRARRFDPRVRDNLVSLCENDVKLYKRFLAEFTFLGEGKPSFEQAVAEPHYICPSLPSFNVLWDIYEEEGKKTDLLRLQRLAKDIKYGGYENEEVLVGSADEEHTGSAPEDKMPDPCPVEIIEVAKSGKKGKQAFLDSNGILCSTEDAVRDHFVSHGYRVVRGEVQFWQAMFGLAFWEEIFDGTGTPSAFNDIPPDLFSGYQFYESRKDKIDKKAQFLAAGNVHNFIQAQLHKHGNTWTRIVFDGGNRDFRYLDTLQSRDVSDFLTVVNPIIFSKIVTRIATNPCENRAGTPDYSIWKDSDVSFIEVKGIREEIRESQMIWLAWMHSEGMPVKIIRVKGKAQGKRDDVAA